MKRAVLLLMAIMVAVLGWIAAPMAGATVASDHPVVAYTYDTLTYDSPGSDTASERGPPALGPTGTAYDAVDLGSHGASARGERGAAATTTTYAYPASLAQVARHAPGIDRVDIHVRRHDRHELTPQASQDVDHAGRHIGRGQDLAKRHGGQRPRLRCQHDHGIATDNGRGDARDETEQ